MIKEHSRRIVIGIGNPERGDDAAGRAVARQLYGTLPADVAVEELDGEATALLAAFAGVDTAFLIDACASGMPAGTIHCLDLREASLPQAAATMSSHGLGVAEAIELARALGQLPPRCIVYAIEGRRFDTGARLSPAVRKAVGDVARRLRAELAEIEEAACTKPG